MAARKQERQHEMAKDTLQAAEDIANSAKDHLLKLLQKAEREQLAELSSSDVGSLFPPSITSSV